MAKDKDKGKDKDNGEASADAPPTPKLLLGIVALNLLITGGVMFKIVTLPAPVAAAPADTEADAEAGDAGIGDMPGPTYEIKSPIVVNLNEASGVRYLKAKMTLEFRDDDSVLAFQKAEQVVRDELLRYLSNLSVKETMGEEAKKTIQKEIVARADRRLGGEGRVTRVFFAEFVVQ